MAKPTPALIGPNAILQTADVIDRRLGKEFRAALMAQAGLVRLPTGDCMIDEGDALALHYALALELPEDEAMVIAKEAGAATADYIIANRIPGFAVRLLSWLPARYAAPLLMRAITKHAWTFIGSGRFRPNGAWEFLIDRRHVRNAMSPPPSLFIWYAAVFTRLYQRLVDPDCECIKDEQDAATLPSAQSYRIERVLQSVEPTAGPTPVLQRYSRPDPYQDHYEDAEMAETESDLYLK